MPESTDTSEGARSKSDVRNMVIDGEWRTNVVRNTSEYGEYRREETRFRDEITRSGDSEHTAEPDRYHLYICRACPWAHRTAITRRLKGLEDVISLSLVQPERYDEGWEFSDSHPDPLYGRDYLREIYIRADSDYTGRVTVPVLWDKDRETVVNNESAEIMRILDSAFHGYSNGVRLFPSEYEGKIEQAMESIYPSINNGVYKAGFAGSQEAYDEAVEELFEALDEHNELLADQRFVVGDTLTAADIALFTTLVRFDHVYHTHFKCNRRRIRDYYHLREYVKDIYQIPGVPETVNMGHTVRHYYRSHPSLNPKRIVPVGPELRFSEPHSRDQLPGRLPEPLRG